MHHLTICPGGFTSEKSYRLKHVICFVVFRRHIDGVVRVQGERVLRVIAANAVRALLENFTDVTSSEKSCPLTIVFGLKIFLRIGGVPIGLLDRFCRLREHAEYFSISKETVSIVGHR